MLTLFLFLTMLMLFSFWIGCQHLTGFAQSRTWQRMGSGPHEQNRRGAVETRCPWGGPCRWFCPCSCRTLRTFWGNVREHVSENCYFTLGLFWLLDTRRDSRITRLQRNKQPISRENWRFIWQQRLTTNDDDDDKQTTIAKIMTMTSLSYKEVLLSV